MPEKLDTDEVFELAQQVERDAADFYRRAANSLEDAQVCDLLRRLAAWEVRHEQRYARMQQAIRKRGTQVHNPDSTQAKALAALSTFAEGAAPTWTCMATTTAMDVLREALKRERAGLVFFKALARFVLDESALAQIARIVQDEHEHIAAIQAALDQTPTDATAIVNERETNRRRGLE